MLYIFLRNILLCETKFLFELIGTRKLFLCFYVFL